MITGGQPVVYDTLYQLIPAQTAEVEQLTGVVQMKADPVRFKVGQQVKFTMTRDDGSNQITNWWWQTDDGHSSAFTLCGTSNPCLYSPPAKGWMTLWTDIGYAQTYLVPYSGMTLEADRSTALSGDTVTFTPKYDGLPGPAARWRWDAPDTAAHDSATCNDGDSPCKKMMVVSGTMWAFTSQTPNQGDSASASVAVTARLKLSCTPNSLTRVSATSCTASAPGGQINVTGWSFVPSEAVGVDSIAGPANGPSWGGQMVTSGIVRVNGKIGNTSALPGVDTINVMPRLGWAIASSTPNHLLSGCLSGTIQQNFVAGLTYGFDCNLNSIFTPDIADPTGVVTSQVHGGPNDSLSYVVRVAFELIMHQELLGDLQPGAGGYAFSPSDSIYSPCTTNGVSSPASLHAVNVTCMNNVGPGKWDDFITRTWRHEDCHGSVTVDSMHAAVARPGKNTDSLAERVVHALSSQVRDRVINQPDGFFFLNYQIRLSSKWLDNLPKHAYSIYTPDSTSWGLANWNAGDGLTGNC